MKQAKKQKRIKYTVNGKTMIILPATKRLLDRTTITEADYLKQGKERQLAA